MRVAEQDLVANSSSDPFTPKTVTYIEHLLAKFHVPSISLGIIHKGHTYVRSFGQAHQSTNDEATPDSLYYIASLTKSFTATTLLSVLGNLKSSGDDQGHPA
ncbi:hypothetical protein NQ176_g9566 [Zarea fungicola]|uniref:Uncharacterized protein n=1 Tax=Zarea fungicola TaxID=93591 RepID=A0ACC1MLX5_9HYPO|nr:hypothetical protein NQ176_g9566 [Lecanicillium fungicola]